MATGEDTLDPTGQGEERRGNLRFARETFADDEPGHGDQRPDD